MAALERAVAFAQVDPVPLAIEQDLDFDVAGAFRQVLQDQPIIAERGLRLAPGRSEHIRESRGFTDDMHALAAAAGRWLDDDRVADPRCCGRQGRVRLIGAVVAGEDRDPRPAARALAAALSPIARIATGGGPTQRIPAAATASAKSAFSARNPKPGWTASAPAASAAATTASTSRRSSAFEPSVGGATARIPSRSHVRRIRTTISPRLAMNRVWIVVASAIVGPGPAAPATMNASNATDATRHRPPTRRAGRRPLAIQRWTDLVVVPMRAAAWLGLSSSSMCVAIVASVAWNGKDQPNEATSSEALVRTSS